MFFIVWGWKARTKALESGVFFCPDCDQKRNFTLQHVKRYFTLYWIPLFSTKDLGEYVECESCKSTFNKNVLSYDPEAAAEKFEAEFAIAAKRVMFKMALADGDIDQAEIDQIVSAYEKIAGRTIERADVEAELEMAREDTRSAKEFLAEVSGTLNDSGKEQVLRSAIAVAKADGNVDDNEVSELHALSLALDLPKPYANGIFMEEGIKTI